MWLVKQTHTHTTCTSITHTYLAICIHDPPQIHVTYFHTCAHMHAPMTTHIAVRTHLGTFPLCSGFIILTNLIPTSGLDTTRKILRFDLGNRVARAP